MFQLVKIIDSSAPPLSDKLGTGCAVACESNKEFTSVVAWFLKFTDEF